MQIVVDNQINKSHEHAVRDMLLWASVIVLVYLAPSLDFIDIIDAIASKGVKSGNVFKGIEKNDVLVLPAMTVFLSLIMFNLKFRIINDAISVLEDVECN